MSATYNETQIKKRCNNLEPELESKREKIKSWSNSGREVQEIRTDKI